MDLTRRSFLQGLGESFLLLCLADFALSRKLIARSVTPPLAAWLKQVNDLALALKAESIPQGEWQAAMASLFLRIDLDAFLKRIDLDGLAAHAVLPASGEFFRGYTFPKIEGLPSKLAFYRDIAGFRKGCSIPPHGHNHLVSSFLVLRGELRGRQFDRKADAGDFLHVQPTVDRVFKRGDFSTVAQEKDNIHWFTANTEGAFIFDFGVGRLKPSGSTLALPNPSPLKSGRLYLDMDHAESRSDGTLKVKRISEEDAYRIYG